MSVSGTMLPAAGMATVLATLYLVRQVTGWFSRLNAESTSKIVQTMEDPSSLKPVICPSVFSEPCKSLSIVIPAFNEEDRLPAAMEETLAYLEARRRLQGPYFTFEVVVVDDGSTDGTAKVVFGYIRKHGLDTIRLLRLPANRGKGCAVKEGMLSARGQRILMMDADGATKVSDLDKLEEKLTSMAPPAGKAGSGAGAPLGMVYGSRHHLQGKACAKRAWYRNILMHGFHVLVLLVAGPLSPKDTQCGFKLFTRRAAQVLVPNQRLQRWCFDVELTLLAQALSVPIEEVGVNWTEIPGSKIRVTSIMHMALELAGLQLAYKWMNLWNVRSEAEIGKAHN
mmetsp:Transcript_22815/g.58481  ORF Transcript_22815/g.58481 Transcript_22815/m.58481 type:complete len:339 (-) Transcript_22815:91-1107(-)|eukprot:jgi/Tetstr1/423147/TSEL_013915.t1